MAEHLKSVAGATHTYVDENRALVLEAQGSENSHSTVTVVDYPDLDAAVFYEDGHVSKLPTPVDIGETPSDDLGLDTPADLIVHHLQSNFPAV